MRRRALLTLVVFLFAGVLPANPASAAPQPAITPITRDGIIASAREMALGQWVSPVTVYANQSATPKRWGTFYAGQTYTGMAYTQQNPQESWATFKSNMASKIGYDWILHDGENSRRCLRTVDGLAQAIEELVIDGARRAELAERGLADIEAGHADWGLAFEGIYDYLCDPEGRAGGTAVPGQK